MCGRRILNRSWVRIVKRFGLERIIMGGFVRHGMSLLRKYVARPLYDYLKEHPEDGDYTSMPDPYL